MQKKYKLLERIPITVPWHELPNFDRALEMAYSIACMRVGVDEDGHINNVIGASRGSHGLFVEFVTLVYAGGMGGQSVTYEFVAYVASEPCPISARGNGGG